MASLLFTPVRLGGLELANRIVIPPMCQYSAQDGLVGDWHLIHYGGLSHSGAGLLVVEATAVTPAGRISPGDLGLWSDETEQAFRDLLSSIRKYSLIPMSVQLAHAGRKASQYKPWEQDGVLPEDKGGWQTEAPSALAYEQDQSGGVLPTALDRAGCDRVRQAFAQAAVRADRCGFNAIELHMAHGYLMHEFLSPLSNVRGDDYGGSPEKRLRYPLEVFEAVRAAFPADKPVGVRISASDWTPGGWDVQDSCRLAVELRRRGCAYIHVSGGGLSPEQTVAPGPGYQVGMAAQIRASLSGGPAMPVIAVGLITQAEQAENIVRSGQADLVAIGRAALFNPHWPWQAARQLGAAVTAPPQYWRSAPYGSANLFGNN